MKPSDSYMSLGTISGHETNWKLYCTIPKKTATSKRFVNTYRSYVTWPDPAKVIKETAPKFALMKDNHPTKDIIYECVTTWKMKSIKS